MVSTSPRSGRWPEPSRPCGEHYKRQLAEQLASPVWIVSGHVFANTIGGPLDARNVTRWWHNLLSRAGVSRRRFQATRHTTATLLLDQGVPLEVV